MTVSREEAANQCVAAFDGDFFRAMCEPARLAVLRELLVLGEADIATVASRLPQDRSVVARHLRHLESVGVVRAKKQGRHVVYKLDAEGVRARMAGLQELVNLVQTMVEASPRPPSS